MNEHLKTQPPRWQSDRERAGAEALGEAAYELNGHLGRSMPWLLAAFAAGILLAVLAGTWDYWFALFLGGALIGMSVGTVGTLNQAVDALEQRKRQLEGHDDAIGE